MKAGNLGICSALLASVCCVGPAVLTVAGLGGLGLGTLIGRWAGLWIGVAAALLMAGWWGYAKEAGRCRASHCRMAGRTSALVALAAATLIVTGFAVVHLRPLLQQAACCALPVSRP